MCDGAEVEPNIRAMHHMAGSVDMESLSCSSWTGCTPPTSTTDPLPPVSASLADISSSPGFQDIKLLIFPLLLPWCPLWAQCWYVQIPSLAFTAPAKTSPPPTSGWWGWDTPPWSSRKDFSCRSHLQLMLGSRHIFQHKNSPCQQTPGTNFRLRSGIKSKHSDTKMLGISRNP